MLNSITNNRAKKTIYFKEPIRYAYIFLLSCHIQIHCLSSGKKPNWYCHLYTTWVEIVVGVNHSCTSTIMQIQCCSPPLNIVRRLHYCTENCTAKTVHIANICPFLPSFQDFFFISNITLQWSLVTFHQCWKKVTKQFEHGFK